MKKKLSFLTLCFTICAIAVAITATPSKPQNADLTGPGPILEGTVHVADYTGPGPMSIMTAETMVAVFEAAPEPNGTNYKA